MKASTTPDCSITTPIAHGGGLIAARRRFPDAPAPWIDLSTGINPVPYPLSPTPPAALTRLPEPEQVAALEAVAATAYGVGDPACVVAAPGTQALIHLLPRLLPRQQVAIVSPTYAEHAAAWTLAGHTVREVATLGEVEEAGVAVVVRPNNPDGAVLEAGALLSMAEERLVVVDEAFADLEGGSLAGDLPHPRLVLLRSFGKTYGLAGLRLGFALSSPAIGGQLRAALGPWAVSGPAVHAGLAALPDRSWLDAAANRLAQDAVRLDDLLTRTGCRVIGGTLLFRLAAHADAARLAVRLGQAGILVRTFADRPSLLRFGIPAGRGAWERLALSLTGPADTPR